MKTKKHLVALIIGLSCSVHGLSQQEAQFTQYNDNMLYYNPAYAGSREMLNIALIHRQQWVGIDGAPMSQSLAIHSPLKYESIGVGLSVLNDRVGPLNQTWINADFAYSLRFKKHKGRLAFGVTGGINLLNAKLSTLYTVDQNDPMFGQDIQNKILPNIGAGIYYHSKYWYCGVSVPRVTESSYSPTQIFYNDRRHYYFSLGGYFSINRMLKLRPSTMMKFTMDAPFALDASLALIVYDKFWFGANYRVLESAGGLFQWQISDQFKLGYAFDISTTKLVRYNFGTHEILLSFDLLRKDKKFISPRFF